MNLVWHRALLASLLTCLAITTVGCGTADTSEELEGADEEVGVTADAVTGNRAVGSTLKTTYALNLRSGPGTGYAILVVMPKGATVTVVASAPRNGFYNVRYGTRTGWALGSYLAATTTTTSAGSYVPIVGGPVRANVQSFANAACAYAGCPYRVGTYAGHDPARDRAIDMMQGVLGRYPADGGARGTKIANFAANRVGTYRIQYVIWRQRINTFDGRGWVLMANRGSITQNHYDHVHLSFRY